MIYYALLLDSGQLVRTAYMAHQLARNYALDYNRRAKREKERGAFVWPRPCVALVRISTKAAKTRWGKR